MDSNIQGRVKVNYIIDTAGHVDSVTVAKSVHPLLDSEAVRVVKIMPDWTPGYMGNIHTRVRFTIPVVFSLGKDPIPDDAPDSSEIKKRLAVKDSMSKNYGPQLEILNNWSAYLRDHLHYPKEAKQQQLTGYVKVRFLVEPTSDVSKYEIEEASLPMFNEEAMRLSEKIAGMKWQTGVKNGQPIRYYIVLPFEFGKK